MSTSFGNFSHGSIYQGTSASTQKLVDFLSKPERRAAIVFKVHHNTSDKAYIISDSTKACRLILDDCFFKGRGHISPGNFVKCMFPADYVTDDTVCLDGRSSVVLSSPFKVFDASITQMMPTFLRSNSQECLGAAGAMEPGDLMNNLFGKVIKVGIEK